MRSVLKRPVAIVTRLRYRPPRPIILPGWNGRTTTCGLTDSWRACSRPIARVVARFSRRGRGTCGRRQARGGPRGRDRRRAARAAGVAERRDERGRHPRRTQRCWCGCCRNAASPPRSWKRRARPSPSLASGASPARSARCSSMRISTASRSSPQSAWKSPPFEPVLRWGRAEDEAPVIPWAEATFPLPDAARIYARSSSDDKGPIVAMLAALDALDAANIPLSANLKFFLEGEEEAGSPNLARTLETHRDRLAADLWIFGDGPIDPRGLPRLALGARGVHGLSPDRVRAGEQPAFRPLRQRSAEPGRAAGRADRLDARAERRHHDRRSRSTGALCHGARAVAPGFRYLGHARVRGHRRDRERTRLRRIHPAPRAQRDPAHLRRRRPAAERDRRRGNGRLRPAPGARHDRRRVARGDRGACREAGVRAGQCAADAGRAGRYPRLARLEFARTDIRPRCRTPRRPPSRVRSR